MRMFIHHLRFYLAWYVMTGAHRRGLCSSLKAYKAMEALWEEAKGHDSWLNDTEKVPVGDDYNALFVAVKDAAEKVGLK